MDAIKEWDRKNLAPGMYEIVKDLYGEEEIGVSFTKEERVLLSRIVYTMLTPIIGGEMAERLMSDIQDGVNRTVPTTVYLHDYVPYRSKSIDLSSNNDKVQATILVDKKEWPLVQRILGIEEEKVDER
jgi:hypothetical protein